MLKISSTARIPLKTFNNSGSVQQRIEYAKNLNAKFYEKLKTKIKYESISVKDYAKVLEEVLPENILAELHIKEKSLFNEYAGRLLIDGDEKNGVTNYILVLPYKKFIPKKNETEEDAKRILLDDMCIAMHENFHLFSSICNPKFVTRQLFYSQKENYIYKNYMYTNLHNNFNFINKLRWKNGLKGFLKTLSTEDRINFLQNCRYRLTEENIAYQEGAKYGENKFNTKYFYFEEKIKIIEKQLYKTIQEARKDLQEKQVKNEGK